MKHFAEYIAGRVAVFVSVVRIRIRISCDRASGILFCYYGERKTENSRGIEIFMSFTIC